MDYCSLKIGKEQRADVMMKFGELKLPIDHPVRGRPDANFIVKEKFHF